MVLVSSRAADASVDHQVSLPSLPSLNPSREGAINNIVDYSQVLVVDDCAYNLFAVKSLLAQFNLNADICQDATTAVLKVMEKTQNNMYQLILMDFCMPEIDGPDTAKMIL